MLQFCARSRNIVCYNFVLGLGIWSFRQFSELNYLLQDPALLEFAWVELVEKNKSVTTEELAEVLYYCGPMDT